MMAGSSSVNRSSSLTGEKQTVEVPPTALKLIGQLPGAVSEGRPVMLVPAQQEWTTVEAAYFRNVSRPFVIKEIQSGRLPHRKVGSHRRIALDDLIAYARKLREQQAGALERMADNARELGLWFAATSCSIAILPAPAKIWKTGQSEPPQRQRAELAYPVRNLSSHL